MGTVTGLTAARMIAIEDASIVDGNIVGNDLILTTHGGTDINAGNVRGPIGLTGATGPAGSNAPWTICTSATRPGSPIKGEHIYETDTGKTLMYYGATTGWKLPWWTKWGYQSITNNQTATTVLASGIGTSETLVNLASTGVATLLNRSYSIFMQFEVRTLNNVTSYASFRIRRTNLAGAVVLGPTNIAKNNGAAGLARQTVSLTAYDAPGAVGSQVWALTAQTDASTIEIWSPSLIIIEDMGPTGNPPAA